MAIRNQSPVEHRQLGIVIDSGSFRPNGNGAITIQEGVGFTPSWVSTGRYRVTFTTIGLAIVFADAQLMLGADDDKEIKLGPADLTNKRLDFFVRDISGAALSDLASDVNTWIHWTVHWRNTRIKKGGTR